MKRLIILIGIALLLASCTTTRETLPFATKNREGKYPVKKARPVKDNKTWSCRQWKHEGR